MIEVICDGHCPLFGEGECELELFPGSRPPGRCPRHMDKKMPENIGTPFSDFRGLIP